MKSHSPQQDHLLEIIGGYRTLLDPLHSDAPERPFVTVWRPGAEEEYSTCTFGDFLALARAFARLYQDRGLGVGETVILIMPQGVQLMAGFAGALLLGAIPTILAYPNFKVEPEKYRTGLSGVTRNIQARLTVLDEAFSNHLLQHIAGAGDSDILRLRESDLMGSPPEEAVVRPNQDQVAFLQHSAGTTGLQKGVALSHRVVLRHILQLARALKLTRRDRIVSWLPLYHDMGLIACYLLPLVAGLHVIMESPVDWVMNPGSFLRLFDRYRGTLSWLPNFAFQFLARRVPEEERSELDLSSIRAIISTSEPIRAHSMGEFYRAYQPCGLARTALQTSYGMAESTFAVTNSRIDGHSIPEIIRVSRGPLQCEGRVEQVATDDPNAVSLVSCGRCLDSNFIKIVDDNGAELPEERLGEILVQSPCLFEGYYHRPDLTAQVLEHGWYHTGDIGFLQGAEVYVIGRKDDTIIVGGRNIYPQDVEEVASQHPFVGDGRSVAFGLEDPDLGTEDLVVVAEVVEEAHLEQKPRIAVEIRRDILAIIGVAPRFVQIVPPRWVVKSTAGKPARSTNRVKFLKERPELSGRSDWRLRS
ncbi:MAG: AMP-binding protein [Acidobacteriota bacterium]